MPRQNFSKIETLPEKDLKQIQSLAKNGYSFKYIFEWIETRGFKIALKTVQIWHKKYLESIKDNSETATKALSAINKQERDTSPNPTIDDPDDLEKIRQSWHIKPIEYYLDNVGKEGDDIALETADLDLEVTTVAIVYDLFVSVSVLTKNRLDLYQQGLAKFPNEQIKSLKLIYEMYSEVTAIQESLHFETAMRSIDKFKRRIKKMEDHDLLDTDD
ncbi:MAG: hypothetical protein RJA74_42 [Pseudomonadota bacterium]